MNSSRISIPFPANGSSPLSSHNNDQILAWTGALLFVNFFGAIANIILLLAIFIHQPLRQSSSCILIAHCIAIDLYTNVISVPVAAIPVALGPQYRLSEPFCQSLPAWIYVLYPADLYATCALAFHRLIATVLPHKFAALKTKKVLIFMVILPWIIAGLLAIIPVGGFGYKMASSPHGGCHYVLTGSSRVMADWASVLSIYLPSVATGFCYSIFLLKTAMDWSKRKESVALQRRMEISRTLLVSFIWHCLALYPSTILLNCYPNVFYFQLPAQLGVRWLVDSFSAINPIFYVASSRLFWDGAKEVVALRWRHRFRGVQPAPSVSAIELGQTANIGFG